MLVKTYDFLQENFNFARNVFSSQKRLVSFFFPDQFRWQFPPVAPRPRSPKETPEERGRGRRWLSKGWWLSVKKPTKLTIQQSFRKETGKKKKSHNDCKEEPEGNVSTITGQLIEINNDFPFTSFSFVFAIEPFPRYKWSQTITTLTGAALNSSFLPISSVLVTGSIGLMLQNQCWLHFFFPDECLFSHLQSRFSPNCEHCLVSYSTPLCKSSQASYINYNSPLLT